MRYRSDVSIRQEYDNYDDQDKSMIHANETSQLKRRGDPSINDIEKEFSELQSQDRFKINHKATGRHSVNDESSETQIQVKLRSKKDDNPTVYQQVGIQDEKQEDKPKGTSKLA